MRIMIIVGIAALLQGCVSTAVGLAGDVVEGTAKAGVGTAKAAGKAVGKTADVLTPGGDDAEE